MHGLLLFPLRSVKLLPNRLLSQAKALEVDESGGYSRTIDVCLDPPLGNSGYGHRHSPC
jgi:hypothetical protein